VGARTASSAQQTHLEDMGDDFQVVQHVVRGVQEEAGHAAVKACALGGAAVHLHKLPRAHAQAPEALQSRPGHHVWNLHLARQRCSTHALAGNHKQARECLATNYMAAYMGFAHSLQHIAIKKSTICSAQLAHICALQDMLQFVLQLNGCGMQVIQSIRRTPA
jgi:hypothetical protein